MGIAERTWRALTDEVPGDDLPPEVRDDVPGNAVKQVAGLTLQKTGDVVVDPKTVLAWLLATVGAPAAFVGLLVPIRESGSMLPQTTLLPWIRSLAIRKWVWVVGEALQGVAVLAIAVVAATLTGRAAGIGILLALAGFALARSLSSLASKDVKGRTIPKGQRGQVSGLATVTSGAAAIVVGLLMHRVGGPETPAQTFAWLLGGAAFLWFAAAAVFAAVQEAPGERDVERRPGAVRAAVALLRDDAPFRRFVVARTLLLVSALAPPFVVALATELGGAGLQGLGPFVLSTGVAALLGGRAWGRAADRSSRRTLMATSASASLVVLGFLAVLQIDGMRDLTLLYPAVYLLLALAHTGTRIARSTYVVDLAGGNKRTDYVAVSNTAMGVLLLVTGAVSAGVASFGIEAALLLLAVLGLTGTVVARSLPEVSAT